MDANELKTEYTQIVTENCNLSLDAHHEMGLCTQLVNNHKCDDLCQFRKSTPHDLPYLLDDLETYPKLSLNELEHPLNGIQLKLQIELKFRHSVSGNIRSRIGFFNPFAYNDPNIFYADIMKLRLHDPDYSVIEQYVVDHNEYDYTTTGKLLMDARRYIKSCQHCIHFDLVSICKNDNTTTDKTNKCSHWQQSDFDDSNAVDTMTEFKKNGIKNLKKQPQAVSAVKRLDYKVKPIEALKFYYSPEQFKVFEQIESDNPNIKNDGGLLFQIKIGDNWHKYTQSTPNNPTFEDAQLVLEVVHGEKYTIKDSLGQVFEHTV